MGHDPSAPEQVLQEDSDLSFAELNEANEARLAVAQPELALTDEESDASWEPENLDDVLNGEYTIPQSSIFRRYDGVALLYPGLVHAFYGEPESGKSIAAQHAAAEVLANENGDDILYLDYESDRGTVIGRLLLMGADKDQIKKRFIYIRPNAHPSRGLDKLLSRRYDLAVIDGMTESLTQSNVTSIDNDEVTKWIRQVPRKIAETTGAAVVMVDHVTKSRDGRGRYALGAQAKLASITGAAYIFTVIEPLAAGQKGIIHIRIAKDRPGGVRPHGDNWRTGDKTQEIATIIVDSRDPDYIKITVEPPARIAARYREDLEDIQACLAVYTIVKEDEGINVGELKKELTRATTIGESERLGDIIAMAKLKGLIRTEKGKRGAKLHYLSDGKDLTDWVRMVYDMGVEIPATLEHWVRRPETSSRSDDPE